MIRQEISAGGKQLGQLYEGGPHLLKIGRQLLSFWRDQFRRWSVVVFLSQRRLKSRLFDQIRTAVLHEKPGYVFVTLQMLWLQRDSHCFLINGPIVCMLGGPPSL